MSYKLVATLMREYSGHDMRYRCCWRWPTMPTRMGLRGRRVLRRRALQDLGAAGPTPSVGPRRYRMVATDRQSSRRPGQVGTLADHRKPGSACPPFDHETGEHPLPPLAK